MNKAIKLIAFSIIILVLISLVTSQSNTYINDDSIKDFKIALKNLRKALDGTNIVNPDKITFSTNDFDESYLPVDVIKAKEKKEEISKNKNDHIKKNGKNNSNKLDFLLEIEKDAEEVLKELTWNNMKHISEKYLDAIKDTVPKDLKKLGEFLEKGEITVEEKLNKLFENIGGK